MDGIRSKRFAAASAFGALLLCLPLAAHAQDAEPGPTPAPVPVITDPVIPSDFSLPSGDDAPQVVGPSRPADAPPRETVVPQAMPAPSPTASATRQPQAEAEPEVRRPAPAAETTPRSSVSVQQPVVEDVAPVADETASPETLSVDAPPLTTDAIPDPAVQSGPAIAGTDPVVAQQESGFWSLAIALLLAVLTGLALFVFVQKRRSTEVSATAKVSPPPVERPAVPNPEPRPQPAPDSAPVAPPAPTPAPVAASGFVQSRRTVPARGDGSGLVTVRSPNAPRQDGSVVTARAPNNGLVTTNLAQKRRDQAAQREQAKPPTPRPVTVKRNISFDWS